MDDFSSLLYKNSPFLPTVNQQSLIAIGTDITIKKVPPLIAIAKEVGLVGITQNQLHQNEFAWISQAFNLTVENLDNFLLGFTIPTTLILGGYALKTHGVVEAIKLFCPPTQDLDLQKLNGYKSFHLFSAYNVVNSASARTPLVGAKSIYKLSRTEVFKDDFYFLAGIEASERLFTDFSNILYPVSVFPA